MKKRLAPTALLAVSTLMLLSACTPDAAETPAPTTRSTSAAPPTASPTPTVASPSPSPTSTLTPEQEAAQAAAVEYFRALNAVRSDPDADFQQVANITTGTHTAAEAELLNDYRSKGIVQIGKNTYTYKGVGPVVEAGGVRSVEVHVCSDSTNSDLVGADGESVLDPNRLRFVDFRLDVVEVGNSWRINGGQSEAADSC